MSNFQDKRQKLNEQRAKRDSKKQELYSVKRQLQRLGNEIEERKRIAGHAVDDALIKLEAKQKQLKLKLEEINAAYLEYRGKELDFSSRFIGKEDHKTQVAELEAEYPIFLMPVRIETRFMTIEEAHEQKRELWVRIFPDDIAVDTHEPNLTGDEVTSAKEFWIEIWKSNNFSFRFPSLQ